MWNLLLSAPQCGCPVYVVNLLLHIPVFLSTVPLLILNCSSSASACPELTHFFRLSSHITVTVLLCFSQQWVTSLPRMHWALYFNLIEDNQQRSCRMCCLYFFLCRAFAQWFIFYKLIFSSLKIGAIKKIFKRVAWFCIEEPEYFKGSYFLPHNLSGLPFFLCKLIFLN